MFQWKKMNGDRPQEHERELLTQCKYRHVWVDLGLADRLSRNSI